MLADLGPEDAGNSSASRKSFWPTSGPPANLKPILDTEVNPNDRSKPRGRPTHLLPGAGRTSSSTAQALRHLFQENASDEYALIWLLSKHTKDTGSEKIYLKDIVRELNLPMPKVSAIARSLQNKGLVRWTHDGNGEEGTYILLTDTAVTSVQAHRQTLRAYHQRVVAAYGEEKFLHLLGRSPSWRRLCGRKPRKWEVPHDQA